MIIPINSSRAYRLAMQDAFLRLGLDARSAEEKELFSLAFRAGWEACRASAIAYLDNFKREDRDDE